MHDETYRPELTETAIPPIDRESIDSVLGSMNKAFGIDLHAEGVKISINYPGDQVFDEVERNFRQEVGLDENLEGALPGFVAVLSGNQIAFFAVNPENLVEMANKYAKKEGVEDTYNTVEDAQTFIAELSVKALVHEITHIAWPDKINTEFMFNWQEYVQQNQPLQKRVIDLQRDKYGEVSRIPVEEEALADAMVEVLTFGRLQSRLNMPEVVETLRELINEKGIDDGLVNRLTASQSPLDISKVRLNEYGEIVSE